MRWSRTKGRLGKRAARQRRQEFHTDQIILRDILPEKLPANKVHLIFLREPMRFPLQTDQHIEYPHSEQKLLKLLRKRILHSELECSAIDQYNRTEDRLKNISKN